MATRIYLPYGLTAPISPAWATTWEKVGVTRYKGSHIKQGTPFKEISAYETSTSATYDVGVVQFVVGPLKAQTINGNVKGQVQARESAVAADHGHAVVIRVVTALGITRGTLLAHFPALVEFSAVAPVNRYFPPDATALTEVVCVEGDYLVIELGYRATNVASTSYTSYLTVGDAAATDLPADETEDELLNPWLEFTIDLAFQSEEARAAYGGFIIAGASSTGIEEGYAATGGLELSGENASDTLYPTEMAGAGELLFEGRCAHETIEPPQDFIAVGYLAIEGTCQAESITPGAYELGVYSAAGSFILEGQCEGGDVSLPIYECVAAGSFKFGTYRGAEAGTTYPDESITAFAAQGGFDIVGSGVGEISSGRVTAMAADTYLGANLLLLSSNCAGGTLYPPVTSGLAVGGVCFVNPDVDLQEVFETWVLTGQAYEPTIWTGFDFNSYCAYQGKVYGAGEDGIYLMEGSDDNGDKIHTGVRIGPHNYGTERKKRLRALRLGGQNNGTRVKVIAKDGEDEKAGYFDVVRGRVPVSRDLEGREFTLDITDFEELSQVEIIPLVLSKR